MAVRRRTVVAALLVAAAPMLAALPVLGEGNERAESVFQLCASCHRVDGTGDRRFLAPAIAGLNEWYVAAQLRKFRAGLRGTHFDDLSGMRMRPMALAIPREEDVPLLAAYVASLSLTDPAPTLTGGDPERGKGLYALCASCHGANGEGLQALNGPRLTHTNDWYLFEQLEKFKAGIRGSNPQDPIAIMMRPMALTLPDEQAMKDVIAYIQTLSN